MIVKPAALKKGDRICIVSPSSEIVSFPRRTKRGVGALTSEGFEVVFAKNAFNACGHEAGTPKERAVDLMTAFQDSSIQCIMASTGGYTSNTVLDHLDFSIIQNNPKILVGFSDITALLNGIHLKTGLVTFHGPTLLPSFGDADGVHKNTMQSFLNVVSLHRNSSELTHFSTTSNDSFFWDKEDDKPRNYKESSGFDWLHKGNVTGKIIGGNFETLLSLLSTEYCPDFDKKILFLEETKSSVAQARRGLQVLEHTGVFKKITGLVYSKHYNFHDNLHPDDLNSLLRSYGDKYGIPVISNVPFGHTEPKLTLPLGINLTINSERKSFTLDEPAVR